MTRAPSSHRPAAGPALGFAADDRGAIMVLGIFMCVLLVGALWYIAGVGEACMFRERMQEASDAVAFSTAVIEARLMNLIVMINLLMAAIESILVAINLIMYATLALGLTLLALGAALSWIGAGEALIAAGEALIDVQQEVLKPIHDEVKPVVQDALEALHTAASNVPNISGTAMWAGAQEIGSKYTPTINFIPGVQPAVFVPSSGLMPLSPAWTKLPVQDGTTTVLCSKAWDALSGALDMVLSGAGSTVLSPVKAIAQGLGFSDAFCELGDSSSPPDTSALTKSLGTSQCNSNTDIQNQCQKAASDNAALGPLESQCGYSGTTPPDPPPANQPASCASLPQQISTAQSEQSQCDQMKQNCQDGANSGPQCDKISDPTLQAKCQGAQSKGSNGINSTTGNGKSGSGSGSGNMNPMQVKDGWHNGVDDAQLLAIVNGDGAITKLSPKFVSIASQGKITAPDPNLVAGQQSSWSQAEMFYDCTGPWATCDAKEEALWNFYWRARFRLVNMKIFGLAGTQAALAELLLGKAVLLDVSRMSTTNITPASIQLAVDIKNATPPGGTPTLH